MTALTTFVDGVLVNAAGLNNLSTNINTLCQQTTGKAAAAAASTKPVLKVVRNSNQSTTSGTPAIISWSAATANTDTMWTVGTPTQITVTTAGWYRITAQVVWDGAGAINTERVANVYVNGTTTPTNVTASTSMVVGAIAVGYVRHQVQAYERLTAGATVFLGVLQGSGSALNVVNTPFGTWLAMQWDAPY